MSSIVKGESTLVFEALHIGYEEAAKRSGWLLSVKACNVCPLQMPLPLSQVLWNTGERRTAAMESARTRARVLYA